MTAIQEIARLEFAALGDDLYRYAAFVGRKVAGRLGVPEYDDLAADMVAAGYAGYLKWRRKNTPTNGDSRAAVRHLIRLNAKRCLVAHARKWNNDPIALAGRPTVDGDKPEVEVVAVASPDGDDSWRLLAAINTLPAKLRPVAAFYAVASPDGADRRTAAKQADSAYLPSLRQAAEALRVSHQTVANRLKELAAQPAMAGLLAARIVAQVPADRLRSFGYALGFRAAAKRPRLTCNAR